MRSGKQKRSTSHLYALKVGVEPNVPEWLQSIQVVADLLTHLVILELQQLLPAT